MSDTTKANLEAAIEAHLADEFEDSSVILSGFILQAVGNGINDNRECMLFSVHDSQSSLITLGLKEHVNVNVEEACFGCDCGDEDDD